MFGYLAAVTTTLELVTGVIILPQRQTALVAKQAAEVDLLSGGRLRLGVGLGWNAVEYEALGEDFTNRGRRSEEQVEVMRRLWTEQTRHLRGPLSHGHRRGAGAAAGAAADPGVVRCRLDAGLRAGGSPRRRLVPDDGARARARRGARAVERAALAAGGIPAVLGMEGRVTWSGDRDEVARTLGGLGGGRGHPRLGQHHGRGTAERRRAPGGARKRVAADLPVAGLLLHTCLLASVMQHVHAFRDDALGDLDAVALVDALRTGKVSRPRAGRGRDRPRPRRSTPILNGLAHETFDRALARAYAGTPYGGYLRRRADLRQGQRRRRGHADHAGHRRVGAPPRDRHGDFARFFLATGLIPLGKTQMPEFGFSASAEHPRLGPVRNPWDTDYTAGRVVVGGGGVRRGRRGAHRPRQRRRRLHPDSGGVQRSGRPQAVARPAAAGQADAARCRSGIVRQRGADAHVRDTAAFYREAERIWRNREAATDRRRHRPGHRAAADRGRHPVGVAGMRTRACAT